jgi:hypothetical protein
MKCLISRLLPGLALASTMVLSTGCGSSNSATTPTPTQTPTPTPQNGTVSVIVSDASTDDWATIGVRVLSLALTPQGGGTPVTVYTAPNPAPYISLLQLDQLGEILGNISIPAGTYTAVALTISGNPGDILLTTSADPEPGFAAAPSTTIAFLSDPGKPSFNKYWSLSDKRVLAYNVFFCSTGGQPPFYGNCIYGANNELRGYTAGRYLDRYMFATQMEYRLVLP